jgi:hypothetical protein
MAVEWLEFVNDATRGRNYHAEHVETIERLTRERDAIAARFEKALTEGAKRREERDAAERKLAMAREAMEFYADPNIYKPHPHGIAFDDRDVSFKAKNTLAALESDD